MKPGAGGVGVRGLFVCLGPPGPAASEFWFPPLLQGARRPGPRVEGGRGLRPRPLCRTPATSCRKLQSLEGERGFSSGFNHAESRESWSRRLPSLGPLPPRSHPLAAGPEPRPRLGSGRHHVPLCCLFHERIQEIRSVGKELGIAPTVIRDEELKTRGFGGGWGPQGTAQGTMGGSKAVGHVAYCPQLHPKRDRPKSSPEPGPREADRLWGPERAAPRALTQALEAAGPRPFPSRSLPGLLTCRGPGSVGQLSEASLFLEYTSSSSRPHPGLALRLPPSGILSPGRLSQQSHCTQSVLAQSHRLRVPSLITRPTLLTPRAPEVQ